MPAALSEQPHIDHGQVPRPLRERSNEPVVFLDERPAEVVPLDTTPPEVETSLNFQPLRRLLGRLTISGMRSGGANHDEIAEPGSVIELLADESSERIARKENSRELPAEPEPKTDQGQRRNFLGIFHTYGDG